MKYFTYDELLRVARTLPGEAEPSPAAFSMLSIERLDRARHYAGIPFVVNSSYRSPAYEVSKGRSGNSAHCTGHAWDIRCLDSKSRYLIVSAALEAGFSRIGIYPRFVHLDDSADHPQKVIWYGK